MKAAWSWTVCRILTAVCLAGFYAGCAAQNTLLTEDGAKLAYSYQYLPEGTGTVILLHGLGSTYDEWYAIRDFLHENQWSTLAMDFRGHGESLDWRGEELNWRHFSDSAFATLIWDIDAAVKHVRATAGADEKIWLIGSSLGANLGLLYAASHDVIAGVVLLSPGFNYQGIETQPVIPYLGERPILLVGSEDDPGTPDICEKLYKLALGPKKMVILGAAGHGSAMIANESSLKGEILSWMNQTTR